MDILELGKDQFEIELDFHKQNLLNCVGAFEEHARSLKHTEDALCESEDALRALLENASQGIITIDGGGVITQVSAMAIRMFGYSAEELLGAPIDVLLPEALRTFGARRREHYFREPFGPMGEGLDLAGRRKDGSEFPVEIALSHVTTRRGVIAISFITDITLRKKSGEEFRRQAALLNQAHEPILIWTVGKTISYWNLGAEALYGFTAEEAIGQYACDLLKTRYAADLDSIVEDLTRDGKWRGELTHTTKDGKEIIVESLMTTLREPDGYVVLETNRDITQRLRMEHALRASEERLRLAVEAAEIGTWDYNPISGALSGDNRARTAFGLPPDAAVDYDSWLSLIHDGDRADVRKSIEAALDPSGDGRFVAEFRTGGGAGTTVRHVYVQGKVFFDAAQPLPKATRFITTVKDVTLRKRSDDQARQSQRLESIGQLAGGVAHDFNNLLTVISGYADMVLAALPPEHELYDSIQEISKAGVRATALTRQLLAFSRQQTSEPRDVGLNTVVCDIEKMLRRLIGEHIELELALDPELALIRADPGHIEQVLVNLAVNARDAMPKGGRLVIETSNFFVDEQFAQMHRSVQPGNYVSLSVSDTGSGMTQEVKARIFEPFFTTKEPGEGTGLGLSTVYGIVEQSRGAMTVYSEPGLGTTFRVLFPRLEFRTEAPTPPPVEVAPGKGAGTILLVEDEGGVRKYVRQILVGHGYAVIEASNGVEALTVAASQGGSIDLLLTDVVMPKMGGADLAREFASLRPRLPVLQMSGYTDRILQRAEVSANYIQKPFTPAVLLARIRSLLP